MEWLYLIVFFIFGAVMGSFYHVVATRLSNDESIIYPASHCPKCNHKLSWYENIPVMSYLFLRGRCKECHSSIPLSYLIVEIVTGLLFAVSFHCFHFSYNQIISLIFISTMIIVIVSDIEYMIILDEVLIAGALLIIITFLIVLIMEDGIYIGILELILAHIVPGVGAFLAMYALKLFGDRAFRKESLGGGDIKLMFLFGLVLGFPLAICTIFLATFIAFPIALIVMFTNRENIIPFGPFLSMSAILILISKVDFSRIVDFLIK